MAKFTVFEGSSSSLEVDIPDVFEWAWGSVRFGATAHLCPIKELMEGWALESACGVLFYKKPLQAVVKQCDLRAPGAFLASYLAVSLGAISDNEACKACLASAAAKGTALQAFAHLRTQHAEFPARLVALNTLKRAWLHGVVVDDDGKKSPRPE